MLSGNYTCTELLEQYLERIEKNAHLNAFVEVFEKSAREKALEIDQKLQQGIVKDLSGMIVGIKDNMCYKGHKVSASSKILEGFESLYSATAV